MNLQRIFTVFALVLLVGLLAGCAFLQDLRLFKGDGQEQAGQEQQPPTVVEGQLGVESAPTGDDEASLPEDGDAPQSSLQADPGAQAGAGGQDGQDGQDGQNAQGDRPDVPATDTRQVALYFAAADGSSLEAETRDLPRQDGIARATLNELIAGPQSQQLSPTLPAAAILEGITINDGLCTVDFSAELIEHLSSDSQQQLLAVYSIVNTLTQFDTVDYVRILVDGAPLNASPNGVDLTAALAPTLLF